MKNIAFLIAVLVAAHAHSLFAQTYDQLNVQLQFFNQYGKAYQRGSLAPRYVGSEYYNDEWMPMDIKFKDSLLRFDAVKLNLINSNLEVLFQGEEKVIAGFFFQYVLIPDGANTRIMVPANIFNYNGKPLTGFVEVFGTGDAKVLTQHHIYIKEPHAQAHITGGFTMDRLMKTSDNFIYEGGALTLVRKKKDLQEYYRRRSSAFDRYFKEHNPNIKDPQQLLALAEFMAPKG